MRCKTAKKIMKEEHFQTNKKRSRSNGKKRSKPTIEEQLIQKLAEKKEELLHIQAQRLTPKYRFQFIPLNTLKNLFFAKMSLRELLKLIQQKGERKSTIVFPKWVFESTKREIFLLYRELKTQGKVVGFLGKQKDLKYELTKEEIDGFLDLLQMSKTCIRGHQITGWTNINVFLTKMGCEMEDFKNFLQFVLFHKYRDYEGFVLDEEFIDNLEKKQVYELFLDSKGKKKIKEEEGQRKQATIKIQKIIHGLLSKKLVIWFEINHRTSEEQAALKIQFYYKKKKQSQLAKKKKEEEKAESFDLRMNKESEK